jgi:hypothetical protein
MSQILIFLSAVPAPLAKMFGLFGDHAIAFIAA